ncbi:MAG: dethiobiotin synthase [Deltaproteobacteria bacterium]|nr:MAG: dethiobiotin synthase [Deltaproteobacteria bacterium]
MLGRWFITGTDTEIGKSAVTACLAAGAHHAGRRVVAAKPVASGVAPGTAGEDAELLGFGAGHDPKVFATWEAPLSPHRAALLEGRLVGARALERWVRELEGETVLVEGVGGWRVPIGPGVEVTDLATWAGSRVIIVAGDRLGVLNHTRLTVDAVRADGHEVLGVVLNRGIAATDLSRDTNLVDLRALLDVPVAVLDPLDLGDRDALARAGRQLWSSLGLG